MSDAITVQRTGLVRFLSWARALRLTTGTPDNFSAGVGFGSEVAVTPRVDPLDEMSAYALAWVYICVQSCVSDLARLPRYVVRNGEPLWEHPALELLASPRRSANPVQYHRQRWADWYLTGNSYDLLLRSAPGKPPVSMQRLHPAKVSHLTASNGDVSAVRYDTGSGSVDYSVDDVLLCADVSYEAGPDGTRGMSRIRALMRDLNVDVKALELANQSVSRGSPAFLVRPASDDDRWDQEQTKKIAESINAMLRKVAGGALVLGGRSEVTPLGFSPRDVEYIAQREATRQTILSAFRVTPTIVGLPGANYATADKEAEGYWSARMADAALRDSADSRLAEMLGKPGDRIVTDFTQVPALHADRGDRLNRAQQLWIMGVPLPIALESEGLGDIELPETEKPTTTSTLTGAQLSAAIAIAKEVATGQIPRETGVQLLVVGFGLQEAQASAILSTAGAGFAPTPPLATGQAAPAAESAPARGHSDWMRALDRAQHPRTEEERTAAWRAYEDDLRGPAEKRLAAVMTRFLAEQAKRIAARASAELGRSVRAADEDAIAAILDKDAELRKLYDAAGPEIQRAIERSIEATLRRMGVEIETDAVAEVARKAIFDSLSFVADTTNDAVSLAIREGLAEGESPSTMAVRLRTLPEFTPARALRVARTETTRAVNAGSIATIEAAADDGIEIAGIEWLTSRDSHVREDHKALDGQRVTVGGSFEIEGASGKGPGQFGEASLDANCRCTILPILEGDE
jgi:phage portal protein BeeE